MEDHHLPIVAPTLALMDLQPEDSRSGPRLRHRLAGPGDLPQP